jgi:hypothetical protein
MGFGTSMLETVTVVGAPKTADGKSRMTANAITGLSVRAARRKVRSGIISGVLEKYERMVWSRFDMGYPSSFDVA